MNLQDDFQNFISMQFFITKMFYSQSRFLKSQNIPLTSFLTLLECDLLSIRVSKRLRKKHKSETTMITQAC